MPLCKIYEIFEKPKEVINGYNLCNTFIEDKHSHRDIILPLCKNIDFILKNLLKDVETSDVTDVTKGCDYLGYWIYGKLGNIPRPCENISNLYTSFIYFSNNHSLSANCSSVGDFHLDYNKFDKKKKLYFHSEIFKWVKTKYETLLSDEKTLCKTYLDECADFYNSLISEDYCKRNKIYGSQLGEFQKQYNILKKFLSQEKKVTSIKELQSTKQYICPAQSMDSKEELQGRGGIDGRGGSDDDISNRNNTIVVLSVVTTVIAVLFLLLFLYKVNKNSLRLILFLSFFSC